MFVMWNVKSPKWLALVEEGQAILEQRKHASCDHEVGYQLGLKHGTERALERLSRLRALTTDDVRGNAIDVAAIVVADGKSDLLEFFEVTKP